jgi:hypothetical protein
MTGDKNQMRPEVKVPELAEAIAVHARAVLAGDVGAAESHVAPAALEAYRLALNDAMRQGPFDRHAAPGLARLGSQYISKVRFAGARGSALMQIRWTRDGDGHWLIGGSRVFSARANAMDWRWTPATGGMACVEPRSGKR